MKLRAAAATLTLGLAIAGTAEAKQTNPNESCTTEGTRTTCFLTEDTGRDQLGKPDCAVLDNGQYLIRNNYNVWRDRITVYEGRKRISVTYRTALEINGYIILGPCRICAKRA